MTKENLYKRQCVLCNETGCDTVFAGHPMHKKCKRKFKRKFGGMIR